jgi:hypothetical protein
VLDGLGRVSIVVKEIANAPQTLAFVPASPFGDWGRLFAPRPGPEDYDYD